MKTRVWPLFAAVALLVSCESAPEADHAEATDAQNVAAATGANYTVSSESSNVEWTGTKPTGQHHGTVRIKEGSIAAESGNITGGRFVMDVTTIQPLDQDSTYNEKLRGHLLSEDFFQSETYPEAVFEITSVQAGIDAANPDIIMKDATHTITGNLTLKDVTKNISFPAKISLNDQQLTADANFNIDRTEWGMNYKSDKSLGDKIIHSTVNLKLHIVATK